MIPTLPLWMLTPPLVANHQNEILSTM